MDRIRIVTAAAYTESLFVFFLLLYKLQILEVNLMTNICPGRPVHEQVGRVGLRGRALGDGNFG